MTCAVCGAENTVRSHIIPKAFALDVRDGANHAIVGSREHRSAIPLQSGIVSKTILCGEHEAFTSGIDKYAVEFVRRVNLAWESRKTTDTLTVDNPAPEYIRRFVLLTIWREVCSRQIADLTLGPYEERVRKYLFHDEEAPDWAIIVQRTNFQMPTLGAANFNLHPYRARFADRGCWMMVVAGVCFFAVHDSRGLPEIFAEWRAERFNPIQVTVADPLPITEVGALKSILAIMGSKRRR